MKRRSKNKRERREGRRERKEGKYARMKKREEAKDSLKQTRGETKGIKEIGRERTVTGRR